MENNMTEKMLAVIAQRLESMQTTQIDQGKDIKELTKAFAAQAVHNEQLRSTQAQVTAIWDKMDIFFGPNGIVTRISDHQAHCPKDKIKQMDIDYKSDNKKIWVAIGLLGTVYATTLVIVLSSLSKGH